MAKEFYFSWQWDIKSTPEAISPQDTAMTHQSSRFEMRKVGARRPSRRPVTSRRIALEELENRCLLAAITWIGSGDKTSWDDSRNWSPALVPGPDDVATIPTLSPKPTITFPARDLTVKSIDSKANLLLASNNTLTTIDSFFIRGATFTFNSGSIANPVKLVNNGSSQPSLAIGASANQADFIVGGTCSLQGNVASNQTIWVDGVLSGGTATLAVSATSTNAGTIRLESSTFIRNSALAVAAGETFTNTGTILVTKGDNGGRSLTGNLVNQGKIAVTGITLTVNGPSLLNDLKGLIAGTGRIDVPNDGTFVNDGMITPGALGGGTGILTIDGRYTQTQNGSIEIEIGGTVPGTDFDQLHIAEKAIVQGNLKVALPLLNLYVPKVGESFKVLTFAQKNGTLAYKNLDLGGTLNVGLNAKENPLDLTLTTRSEEHTS